MERKRNRRQRYITIAALSASTLTACTVDSYLNDVSNVQCDGRRTMQDLSGDGLATFVVHGKEQKDVAVVTVRRLAGEVSVKVTGEVTGPPQQVESDGFTKPTTIVDGAELSTFGAGAVWVVDARPDSIVIQGNCDGGL